MSDRFLLPFSEYQIVRQVISLNFKTSSCPTGSWVQLSEYRNVWLVISLFLKQLYVRQVHTFDFQNIKMSDRLSPYIFKIFICPTDSYLQLSENRNVRQVISFNFETSICPTDSYLQLVEYRNVRQVIFLYFKVFIWLTELYFQYSEYLTVWQVISLHF